MTPRIPALLLACLSALSILPATAAPSSAAEEALQPSGRFSVYGHGAAATPPMGWNPWNAYRTEVDQTKLLASAEAIRARGLQAAGYRYINLDDGWWLQRREDGGITIRTSMLPIARLPDGSTSLRPWTDHLHAMGFKAGLYTDIGRNACSQAHDLHSPNLPVGSIAEREIGLEGFEYSDLKTMFQDWGFDYIKVDACGLADFGPGSRAQTHASYRLVRPDIVRGDAQATNALAVETRYERIGRLLAELNPDNDYVLSICPWGEAGVRDWGGRHGNLWRTSPDIEPHWDSMLRSFDSASRRELYAGPGRWNDPDMLAIGLGEFDGKHLVNARSHFSLWSVLAAPLLMGFDITRAPDSLVQLLSNPEVIAVNQDPAGNQGVLVARQGDVQVLVKPLQAAGERAVVLFNRGDRPARATVDPVQLKLDPARPYRARDLWQRRDLAQTRGPISVQLGAHESVMLRVAGTAPGPGTLLSAMTARIHVAVDGLPVYSTDFAAPAGTPRADSSPYDQPLRVAGQAYPYGIGAHANSRLEVKLDGGFARFTARVGLQDLADASGSARFLVYGDGRLLAETALLDAHAGADLDVDVSGVQVLELVSRADGVAAGALPPQVAWADARLH